MKNSIIYTSFFPIVISLLLISPLLVAANKYPPVTVDMVLTKVAPHTYYVRGEAGTATDNEGFISNAGFVVTNDGVVVFDTLGSPSLGAKLLQEIRSVTDKPVVKVILSHYHADHIYGLQVFKELGAEIIAPAGALDYLNSAAADERLEERRFSLDPWVNDSTRLVAPDVLLKKSTELSVGGLNLIINVVGSAHSDGDLTMYVEQDRVLFSGDIIFEGRVAYLGDADTKHWLQVLRNMETSKLVALVPGHGPAAADPNKAISMTRRYLAYIRQVMGVAVANFTPFAEAYASTDWHEFSALPAFSAANRRNAYQVFLSLEEEELLAE